MGRSLGSVVNLHIDTEGAVWLLGGDRAPENTKHTRAEFLSSGLLHKKDVVRILGIQGNVRLITDLYAARTQKKLASLQVATPLACSSPAHFRTNPQQVLLDMRRWNDTPSRGGWHEVTEAELVSYELALALKDKKPPEQALDLLHSHPAWPYLSMIPHIDQPAACVLMACILYPRFFVDTNEPDRLSKLEAYLGIQPTDRIDEKGRPLSPAKQRYEVVIRCWKGDQRPTEQEFNSEPYFLWRTYCKYGETPRGEARASQRFIAYLRHTWMDAIYADKNTWREPLFEPNHFFTPSEAAWFKEASKRFAR